MIWKADNDPQNLQIEVDRSVETRMRRLYWDALPNEIGGFLVGTYPDTYSVHITDIIHFPPGRETTFDRPEAGPEVIQKLRSFFYGTPRKHYVGEWHTHPKSSPDPSPTDLSTLREISEDPRAKCPSPILLILGGAGDSLTGIFCGDVVRFERGNT